MKLTTRGRYAVTAMLDLTIHGSTNPVSLGDISAREDISLAYLEQLFGGLRKAGLVDSVRGPGGGYRLARADDAISIAAVIDAVDESVDATRCGGNQNCRGDQACLTHDLWEGLSANIRDFLSDITLGELARRHALRNAATKTQTIKDMRPSAAG
ncbi:MAG: Rrf2 family transcriptional regulator [Gammaproteobacteria bacterium]|nr:Rrf2 family transcriptional regulator [Gammaproteobacteria bacterium]